MAGELILIVEHNDKNLKLVRDLLRFKGYRTLRAGFVGYPANPKSSIRTI